MLANKILKIILSVIILALCFSILPACGSTAIATKSAAQQKAIVTKGNISKEITATGNLSMPNQAKLTFGASGTVDQINVKIGDSVTRGQVLASLDSVTISSLKQSLLQAQINVKQAQMNLDNASTPTVSSSGTTVTAPDPLDVEAKELSLESANISLESAQRALDGATLIAPFDGWVAAVNSLVGDKISSGTVAIRLIDPTQLRVDTLVSEMDIFNVNPGSKATINVSATGDDLEAAVAAIAPSATSSSGVVNYTVQLKVTTPEKNLFQPKDNGTQSIDATVALKEGLSVSITLVIEHQDNVLIISSKALSKQGANYIATVLKNDGTTEKRTVQAGISDWQNTYIVSGLNEGDVVLIPTSTSSSKTTTTTTTQQQMGGGAPPGMGGGGPPP